MKHPEGKRYFHELVISHSKVCVVSGRNAKATVLIMEDMRQFCRWEL